MGQILTQIPAFIKRILLEGDKSLQLFSKVVSQQRYPCNQYEDNNNGNDDLLVEFHMLKLLL